MFSWCEWGIISLCVKKLKNFMRVYANRERAVCAMHEASLA